MELIYWLLASFEKCDWAKYLINIHKHNYESNKTGVVTFCFYFSFHRVIITFKF